MECCPVKQVNLSCLGIFILTDHDDKLLAKKAISVVNQACQSGSLKPPEVISEVAKIITGGE